MTDVIDAATKAVLRKTFDGQRQARINGISEMERAIAQTRQTLARQQTEFAGRSHELAGFMNAYRLIFPEGPDDASVDSNLPVETPMKVAETPPPVVAEPAKPAGTVLNVESLEPTAEQEIQNHGIAVALIVSSSDSITPPPSPPSSEPPASPAPSADGVKKGAGKIMRGVLTILADGEERTAVEVIDALPDMKPEGVRRALIKLAEDGDIKQMNGIYYIDKKPGAAAASQPEAAAAAAPAAEEPPPPPPTPSAPTDEPTPPEAEASAEEQRPSADYSALVRALKDNPMTDTDLKAQFSHNEIVGAEQAGLIAFRHIPATTPGTGKWAWALKDEESLA